MLKTRIMTAIVGVVMAASAGSAVFAADMKGSGLSKEQMQQIEKDCKADNKGKTKAYKACVAEKTKAAKTN